jgi:hypothetical protein
MELSLFLNWTKTRGSRTTGDSVKQRPPGGLTFAVSQPDPQRGSGSSITRGGARSDARCKRYVNANGLRHTVPNSGFEVLNVLLSHKSSWVEIFVPQLSNSWLLASWPNTVHISLTGLWDPEETWTILTACDILVNCFVHAEIMVNVFTLGVLVVRTYLVHTRWLILMLFNRVVSAAEVRPALCVMRWGHGAEYWVGKFLKAEVMTYSLDIHL